MNRGRPPEHGDSHTPLHRAYEHMMDRCHNVNCERYPHYGGRGITVCDEWRDNYPQFRADMGPHPGKEFSLDREDNDKDYDIINCRWSTLKTQMNNTSRNINLTWNGETLTIAQWAERLGIKYHTLYRRINVQMLTIQEAAQPQSKGPRV